MDASHYVFFAERWRWTPEMVDEQPLAFTRWAPGLVNAADAIREQKRKQAEKSPPEGHAGPRFNGGAG